MTDRHPAHADPSPPSSPGRRQWIAGAGALLTAPWLLQPGTARAAAQIGQAAPGFSLAGSDGKTYSLAELQGRIVVLEWTNHDCPFVRKHYGADNMQALQREAAQAGAVWLSIISSAPGEQGHVSPAQANELSTRRQATPTAVLFDPSGAVGKAYQAQTTPHMYIISADGMLRYMGGIDSIASTRAADLEKAEPLFRNALRQVIAGEPVDAAVTRPYGCSIKYAA